MMEGIRSSLVCLALLSLLLVKDAQQKPQSANFKYTIGDFANFQPLQPLSSQFLNEPSFFSQQQSYFGKGQTPFVGYGPNYFYTLGNTGLNFPANQQCPVVGSNCIPGKYRSFDGSCNNYKNPAWGAANTPYGRLVQPKYSDEVRQPPLSVTGKPLPSSRALSVILFPDVKVDDPFFTLATMQWGQIVTHDMSLASGSTLAEQRAGMCCGPDTSVMGTLNYLNGPQECFPLEIPPEDPLAKSLGTRCVTFSRTRTDQQLGCPMRFKSAEQMTVVSHWIDGSIVYGSDDQTAQSLRTFQGGKLITEFRNGREWPPENVNRSMVCEGPAQKGIGSCYLSGDIRINQNTQLTVLQILLLREHNRIAGKLLEINPHWDDETLYQETRRIVIAEIQHITYYEWLPILLGLNNLLEHGVIYDAKHAYINDYHEHIDPSVLNEHATAAFRLFHTNIQGFLDLTTESRYSHGSIRLSDHFNDPTILEESDNFDDLTRGLATQPQRNTDLFHTSEITDFLFRNKQVIGFDLKAIDIQRGRDHGLASYNDLRQFCGIKRAHHFEEFADFIEPALVEKLKELYAHPDDVDLVVGGGLEKLVPGTLSGPTYLCIMLEQFYRTRVSDRFFYERGDHPAAFLPQQLTEVRKTSLARLMCDNGDHIVSMQPRAFLKLSDNPLLIKKGKGNPEDRKSDYYKPPQKPKPSGNYITEKNPTVSCHDYEAIPFVNLEAWRDLNLKQNIYTSHLLQK